MFRVTDADGGIIIETSHRPTAEQSKRQYEASMGKKAKLVDLAEAAEPKKTKAAAVEPVIDPDGPDLDDEVDP